MSLIKRCPICNNFMTQNIEYINGQPCAIDYCSCGYTSKNKNNNIKISNRTNTLKNNDIKVSNRTNEFEIPNKINELKGFIYSQEEEDKL